MSTNPAPAMALLPPHGLDQLIATFGDIFAYIRPYHTLNPRWQSESLEQIALPFPLALSWDLSRSVHRISCHKLIAGKLSDTFAQIQRAGLTTALTSFGGCFSFRPQRPGSKLSTHAWGIAIDLNPAINAQGTAGKMDPALVAIFRDAGFKWGGEWQGKSRDPMHFQFCTGY